MKPHWILLFTIFLLLLSSSSDGALPHGKKDLRRVTGDPQYTYFDINNISTVLRSDGIADIDVQGSNSGFVFPKGSGKTAMFESGLVWGGYVGGQVRVGGSTYRTGLQPGKILSNGSPDDPSLPGNRIYRVRPDYLTAPLTDEMSDQGQSADAIRAQYAADWSEWPAADGAPYTDVNHDGHYDPLVDVPGMPGAGQTVWFVCNDLNPNLTTNLYGSQPIGIEMQVTAWAYTQQGSLSNMLFKKYVLINKGTNRIDSMYISQWADPDIGDATDDFAGCDTLLNLGYAYNANAVDRLYNTLPPPAAGFVLLQGPIVPASPGDSANFLGRRIAGRKNLSLAAFYYFANGDLSVTDPTMGNPAGSQQFYNFFQGKVGKTGAPFVDPNTGLPTRFALAGDAVRRTGWIDGQVLAPGDRRIGLSAGPLTMAVGDTQEVIVAEIAAGATPGTDRLNAIALLKEQSIVARSIAMNGYLARPEVRVDVFYPSATMATIAVTAVRENSLDDSLVAELFRPDRSLKTSFPLFDDGLHGDGAAHDGTFAAATIVSREAVGLSLDIVAFGATAPFHRYELVAGNITTAGLLTAGRPILFSDNINNDSIANPGENIRYGIMLQNQSAFDLNFLTAVPLGPSSAGRRDISLLARGSVDSMVYNGNDPASYFSLDIPPGYTDSVLSVPVEITDGQNNRWTDTVIFHITPLRFPIHNSVITHAAGSAAGNFEIQVVDPAMLRDRLYVIRGIDEIDSADHSGFTLFDSTDGRVLLANWPLPDSFGHNIPVTDGFKVRRGSIQPKGGFDRWDVPAGERAWSWTNADGLGLSGFNGAMDMAYGTWINGSTIIPSHLHDVLIVFAGVDPVSGALYDPNDTTASFAYRYLRHASLPTARPEFAPFIVNTDAGYPFQDFKRSMPFAAYDLQTHQRLSVGFLENNAPFGLVDGRYYPPLNSDSVSNTDVNGAREFFFIFAQPYSAITDPSLERNIAFDTLPIMWFGTPTRRGEAGFQTGDEFAIYALHPPSSQDRWIFNPAIRDGVKSESLPATFELQQNYPNPFNPTTDVGFRISSRARDVPDVGFVTLKIYDLLGREVATLVNERKAPGEYHVRWNATNNNGKAVSSGVYFYRLDATGIAEPTKHFTSIKKMLLVR